MEERFVAAKFQVYFSRNILVWSPHFQEHFFKNWLVNNIFFLTFNFPLYYLEWFQKILLCGNESTSAISTGLYKDFCLHVEKF